MAGRHAGLLRPPRSVAAAASPIGRCCPTAVEEMLRFVTPVMNFRRQADAATPVLGGQQIKADEKVVFFHISANRDETVFDRPAGLRRRAGPQPAHRLRWRRPPLLPGRQPGPDGDPGDVRPPARPDARSDPGRPGRSGSSRASSTGSSTFRSPSARVRNVAGVAAPGPAALEQLLQTPGRSVMMPSTPRSSRRPWSPRRRRSTRAPAAPPDGPCRRSGGRRAAASPAGSAPGPPRSDDHRGRRRTTAAAGSRLASRRERRRPRGPWPCTGRGPRARRMRGSASVGERGHAHPVQRLGLRERLDERDDDAVVLGVDVPADLGPSGQQLVQAGDGLVAVAAATAGYLLPRHLTDQARGARRPGPGRGRGWRAPLRPRVACTSVSM